ncbi:chemotaxis-specific protein-glutamate methyltransferase CheB [Oscillatoria amoena NRMC-F 0135]|nr:chemotaxis-specific protein-glutamate methyltransferase CheB [Geitlerinema splendidum]MDL5049954.1 chemotaxis-specific protein-glutamate methyltransferase CheB [Oscillatoria amoena NRMC-F 0135]
MPIRVLLVEDSPIALAILKRILSSSPDIEIVGTARTGKEALALIPQVQPQVICTDLHMPQMDGLELTQEVMATFPKPILVVSASVQDRGSENVFKLLQAGAIDVFPKPLAGLAADYEKVKNELISKIKILAGVSVFTQRRRVHQSLFSPPAMTLPPTPPPARRVSYPIKMIAIGASTGGPQALHRILSPLPADFPLPIICVQHISEGFLQGLVDWLEAECQLPVKIAAMGEFPHPQTIYFPPEKRHLELDPQGRFYYSQASPVSGHCPSVTVTFESVASVYGRSSLGILLTGMGRDGAAGLSAIARAGGLTIAQDEQTSVVFGMPREAIALGAAQQVLPIGEIAKTLLGLTKSQLC